MKIYRDDIPKERKMYEKILEKQKNKFFYPKVSKAVTKILKDVEKNGDDAIVKYAKKFDNVKLNTENFRVKKEEYDKAYKEVSKEFLSALKLAKDNIYNFHKKQIQKPVDLDNNGVRLSLDIKPVDRVGVYVPGGEYSYIGVLLMCVIPAKIAKVSEVVVCSPLRESKGITSELLVVAKEAQVDEFYKIGGVHAIGALAFGTKTIKKVDKIVGPGNIYVTEAKRQVFSIVGIDLLAGPSEIMVVADNQANPEFISYDLLAQAEHGHNALAVLITTSKKLADCVKEIIDLELEKDTRNFDNTILTIIVEDLYRAAKIINDYGPEHLEIILKDNEEFASKIKNAGSVLIGEYSTAALTDYTAGVNHVLPTGGAAKFSSVLTVNDFIKKINIARVSKQGLMRLSKATSTLAKIEGFNYHSSSIKIRTQ